MIDTITTPDYDVVVRSELANPTLSVIVAIHDMEKNGYLADCLASFDAQNCQPGRVEYVLADDCSSDGSLALACSWARGRDDVTIVHLRENMRQGAARNRAIDESRGRWFSIVDADDAVTPDYASSILDAADDTGSDAIVVRWIQLVDERLRPIGNPRRNLQSPDAVGMLNEEKTKEIILRHWQFGVWPRWLFDDPENRFLEGVFYEDTPVGTRWLLQLTSVSEAPGGGISIDRTPILRPILPMRIGKNSRIASYHPSRSWIRRVRSGSTTHTKRSWTGTFYRSASSIRSAWRRRATPPTNMSNALALRAVNGWTCSKTSTIGRSRSSNGYMSDSCGAIPSVISGYGGLS